MIKRPKRNFSAISNQKFKPVFFNTLSGKMEEIIPKDFDCLKMYVCGPTVYDRPHIGNARSAVVYDLFFRLFLQIFNKVCYVRNITDIDDKINAEAKRRKISAKNLTQKITELYHRDIEALNILRPDFEPKVSENIPEIIQLIQEIINVKAAYISNKHVLFDVSAFPSYGKLSGRKVDELISGARVEIASYKKNPLDFVLWKPSDEDDDESSLFESPWGKGRPGWHIECSAMSQKFLGQNFDIHGGGADLQFPHHENEIAQSCSAYPDCNYAHHWIHNGFLTINGEKMSKSLKNFTTVNDLLEKNVSGAAIHLMLISSHYRKPLDFNDKALSDAVKTVYKFNSVAKEFLSDELNLLAPSPEILHFLCDDLNVSKVMAFMHSQFAVIKNEENSKNININSLKLQFASDLYFLGLQENKSHFSALKNQFHEVDKQKTSDESELKISSEEIEKKLLLRLELKTKKDFIAADQIRKELLAAGIAITDNPGGKSSWHFFS